MEIIEKTTLYYALEYFEKKFSIIPLGLQSKIPSISSWEEYQNMPADKEQIIGWFSNGHVNNNIAIVTGKVSRIIAFDIDGEEARNYFWKVIENNSDEEIRNAVKNTFQLKTGSGNTNIIIGLGPEEFGEEKEQLIRNSVLWHCKEKGSSDDDNKHHEIRLKGEGGYIVAPPSIHPNGNKYEFMNELSSLSMLSKQKICKLISILKGQNEKDRIKGEPIAAPPNNKAEDESLSKSNSYDNAQIQQYQLDEENIADIVTILKPHYQQGLRNDFVLYLSGWMRKGGVVYESVYKIIEALAVNDEEREARFRTLKETYKKEKLHDIKGYSGFLSLITDQLHDEEKAHQLLCQVNNLFLPTENRYEKDVNCEKIALEEESQKQRLIKLAKANSEFYFKDQYKKTYAIIRLKDHSEIISLDSNKFKHFLSKLYYDYTKGMIVNQESLNDTIRIIEANTIFEGQTIPLNLRIAWGNDNHDSIYYDMTDEKWRCIKVTKDGWNIINSDETSTILFIRYNQNPQVEPDRNYDLDIFDKLLDLTNIIDPKNRLLTKVWIISLLIPDIAHAINITHGEKGSAKTTFCVMIKELVDPDALGLLTTPNDKKEFVQQLSHNHLVVYDNVKSVPHWFSDEICRAVTGIGNSKRRLYSDDEDIIYRYKRCVMVNGINISLTEPDALDRSILTEVARIPNEQRRELSQVMAEFEQIKPELLAYILDTLVKALQIKPTIQLTNLPRMADLAIWGESIARAMGYRPREFINAYYENIGKQNIEALESQPLGQVIPKFCDDYLDDEQLPHKREWEGSPAELLNKLKQTADGCGIDTSQRLWPKSPSALVRRLNTIRSNLLEGVGIKVRIDRITVGDKARKNTSTIRIARMPPLAPLSPPEQIHAQNQGKNGGGISDGGDITSTPKQIPPPENDQNHAQNTESGGSGDSGGIFRNPSVEDKVVFSGYDTATLEQELIIKTSNNTGKNYLR